MTRPPMSPGDIAVGDQLLAFASEDLDVIVTAVRTGDEQFGAARNLGNIMAYLVEEHSQPYLAALVVVAARRIGGGS